MKTKKINFDKITSIKLKNMVWENYLFHLEFTPDGKGVEAKEFLEEVEKASDKSFSQESLLDYLLETLTKSLDAEWIQLEILETTTGYSCTGEVFNWKD